MLVEVEDPAKPGGAWALVISAEAGVVPAEAGVIPAEAGVIPAKAGIQTIAKFKLQNAKWTSCRCVRMQQNAQSEF
ncbi:MAG: hypothetical protein WBW88_18550 [Rhodothermales bacterium]